MYSIMLTDTRCKWTRRLESSGPLWMTWMVKVFFLFNKQSKCRDFIPLVDCGGGRGLFPAIVMVPLNVTLRLCSALFQRKN